MCLRSRAEASVSAWTRVVGPCGLLLCNYAANWQQAVINVLIRTAFSLECRIETKPLLQTVVLFYKLITRAPRTVFILQLQQRQRSKTPPIVPISMPKICLIFAEGPDRHQHFQREPGFLQTPEVCANVLLTEPVQQQQQYISLRCEFTWGLLISYSSVCLLSPHWGIESFSPVFSRGGGRRRTTKTVTILVPLF